MDVHPTLAMQDNDNIFILSSPGSHLLARREDWERSYTAEEPLSIILIGKIGGPALVVRKGITGEPVCRMFGWIAVLHRRTEVVDVILIIVSCIKERFMPLREPQ